MALLPKMRRSPLFASDVRHLGGVVSVHTDRDRCGGGEPVFRVGHVSGGGDIAFLSMPMMLEDHAAAAATSRRRSLAFILARCGHEQITFRSN
jgi:hypothetical protein